MPNFKKHISDFIIESHIIGCLVIDYNANILFSNKVFVELMNGMDASVEGLNLIEVLREEEKEATSVLINTLFEKGVLPKTVWKIVNNHGNTFYLEMEGRLIEVDGEKYGIGIFVDKTEEHNVKSKYEENSRALQYVSDQHELAIQTAKLGIWRLNLATSENFWNDELLAIFDLTREEWQADPEIWNKMIIEADLETANTNYEKILQGETDIDVRFRIKTNDGTVKHIYATASPFYDENGDMIEVHGVNIDISHLVKSEQLAKEKEEQIKNITDKIPGVVLRYVFHKNGNETISFLSNGVTDIFELDSNDVQKNPFLIFESFIEEDRAAFRLELLKSNETLQPLESFFTIITKSGVEKSLHVKGNPAKALNGDIAWDTVIFDITEQKAIESKVRERQQILDNLTDQIPGMVYIYQLSPDGSDRFVYQNKGIADIYEIEPCTTEIDTSFIWSCIHPDDVAGLTESVQKSAQHLTQWNKVYRIITPSGKLKHIQGSGLPEKLEDGTIQWYSIGLDITEEIEQKNRFDKQREQLENITNKIQGVVLKYRVHTDGTDSIPYISNRVNEFWGVDAETVIADINKAWARVVPEDIESTQKTIQKSVETFSEWSHLMRFVSASGKIVYMHGYGQPKQLEDGTVEYDTVMIDVTDQELAKKEAKEKQRELDIIGDQIPGVVFTYHRNPDGTDGFSNFSDGFEELHGLDRSKAAENPKLLWEQTHPDDLPGLISALMESAASLSKIDYQFRLYRADGELRYLQCFGSPSIKEDGTIVWNAINLDITDRKLAEIEIAEKSKQLQSITDQIPGVVVRYQLLPDGTDKVLFMSDGVEVVYGISKKEALESTAKIWEKYHEEDVEALRDSIQKSASNLEPWEHIYRYYNTKGEIGYLQGFGTPQKMEDGSIIWDAITIDITKRMEAEIEAHRSNSKLRAFIKSSPIAIYQIEPDGKITDFWNPAAEHIFGWTREEVIGNTIPHLRDDFHNDFEEIIEDIRINKKPRQFPVTRHNRYGEELILEITAGPLFDENGKLTDLLIIANDITELEEYRKTLESALREKEILLQEIHHRVKNNLAIVSGLLELQALKDDNEHDISVIIEARNRIHSIAMVHEQLYQDMDFSHINPAEYYRKLLSKLQANTTSTEPNINYDLKFDIEKININRAVPLGLLINELFTNSIKHAFKDGKGNLKLHFAQKGALISVYYEDDGPGFSIDEIKNKNTIGWQLIETLLLQLDSTYEVLPNC